MELRFQILSPLHWEATQISTQFCICFFPLCSSVCPSYMHNQEISQGFQRSLDPEFRSNPSLAPSFSNYFGSLTCHSLTPQAKSSLYVSLFPPGCIAVICRRISLIQTIAVPSEQILNLTVFGHWDILI